MNAPNFRLPLDETLSESYSEPPSGYFFVMIRRGKGKQDNSLAQRLMYVGYNCQSTIFEA